MNTHELALKTYQDLQKRKREREKKAERDFISFKAEGVVRANKKRYQDLYSKRRVY